ncbi:Cleavage factor two protein 2 [Cyphellophora attinorum]|uniref:Cleavage and polyadenylation specificity factor subunit 2 n=1 Tax=Cyphellophora attinorum TaxID=1664694 RepID=A0A0N1NZN9_9EURO|nr:Cleavage factor two protein 2 [Phialophora attinorum]KPI42236.1 Cleavage factor two protein 2 [Phialophora attinorum]
MFTFTPLQGAQSQSRVSQSLLELDGGVKVLVDVGWDERFDTHQLAEIEKHTSTLSFILLTHPTLSHVGAYAHCCKHIPHFSQIPAYATSPVIAFGRTLTQDLYSSSPVAATFIPASASPEDDTAVDSKQRTNILRQAPTVEEINKYFTAITPLKYSQPLQPSASHFSPSLEGLTLTAYNAGHTIGGTIWRIQHGMESIVYAVDWNQARENVIAGASWFGGVGGGEVIEELRKPTALVCSSTGGDKVASLSRQTRDATLLGHIKSCLAKGGSVLIPTDSSARMLELAWILERAWHDGFRESPIKDSKVYMASKSANATLRHARSLLEWMDDSIVREFEGEEETAAKTHRRSGSKQINGNSKPSRPFEFRHVKIVERKTQLDRCLAGQGARVILASDLSLDWGYSKSFLDHIAQSTSNLILLTEKSHSSHVQSTGATIWKWYQERQDGVAVEPSAEVQLEQVHGGGRTMQIQVIENAPLSEQEMQQYQQYLGTQRQMESTMAGDATGDVVNDNLSEESESSSEDESDDEQQGRALNVTNALGHNKSKITLTDEDLGVNILVRKKNTFDFDVRDKRGRNAMFPYSHSKKRGDDFGEFIKPEDFLREEEKEEQDTAGLKSGDIGQKRRWDDRQKAEPARKRRQGPQGEKVEVNNDDSSDDSDESDVEEVEQEGNDGPSKAVFSTKEVTLNCRLAFVDFAGLHDQRSLQMLIPLIGPKKLILTGGSTEETLALAADCQELLGVKVAGEEESSSSEIFTPSQGQMIDASVDTNAWTVKLTRNLVKRLHWQSVKDVGVVTLQGQLRAEMGALNIEDDPKQKKQKLDTDVSRQETPEVTTPNAVPVLDTIPSALAASIRSVAQLSMSAICDWRSCGA